MNFKTVGSCELLKIKLTSDCVVGPIERGEVLNDVRVPDLMDHGYMLETTANVGIIWSFWEKTKIPVVYTTTGISVVCLRSGLEPGIIGHGGS